MNFLKSWTISLARVLLQGTIWKRFYSCFSFCHSYCLKSHLDMVDVFSSFTSCQQGHKSNQTSSHKAEINVFSNKDFNITNQCLQWRIWLGFAGIWFMSSPALQEHTVAVFIYCCPDCPSCGARAIQMGQVICPCHYIMYCPWPRIDNHIIEYHNRLK